MLGSIFSHSFLAMNPPNAQVVRYCDCLITISASNHALASADCWIEAALIA